MFPLGDFATAVPSGLGCVVGLPRTPSWANEFRPVGWFSVIDTGRIVTCFKLIRRVQPQP